MASSVAVRETAEEKHSETTDEEENSTESAPEAAEEKDTAVSEALGKTTGTLDTTGNEENEASGESNA